MFMFVSSVRLQYPEISHGDDFADAFALVAAENFSKIGWFSSHGLPVIWPRAEHVPPTIRPDDPNWKPINVFGTYTRVPAIWAWINGACFPLFGDNLFPYRLVAVSLSFLGLLAFFAFVLVLSNSIRLAAISTTLYISNPYFIANFDSINQHAYMDSFRNIALLGMLLLALHMYRRPFFPWIITWLALLICSLSGYEYLPFLTISILLVSIYSMLFHKSVKMSIAVFLLGTGIAAGLIFHFALVSIHYGSIHEAVQDRLSNFVQRMAGNKNLLGTSGEFTWADWLQLVQLRFVSQVSMVGWANLILLSMFGCVSFFSLSRLIRQRIALSWGVAGFLVLGSCIWYFLMRAHCMDHAGLSFLQRFLLPGISLMLAIPCETAFRLLEQSKVKFYIQRILACLIIGVYSLTGLMQSELPLTPDKMAFEEEFLKIKKSLILLKPELQPSDIIATNVMRPSFTIMAYTKTRTLFLSDINDFNKNTTIPKFFIYVPLNNPESQQLGLFLEKSYRVRSVCDNKRLPFYVMEKI